MCHALPWIGLHTWHRVLGHKASTACTAMLKHAERIMTAYGSKATLYCTADHAALQHISLPQSPEACQSGHNACICIASGCQLKYSQPTFGRTEPDRSCFSFASYMRQVRASSGRCFCLSVSVCRHLLFRISHTYRVGHHFRAASLVPVHSSNNDDEQLKQGNVSCWGIINAMFGP